MSIRFINKTNNEKFVHHTIEDLNIDKEKFDFSNYEKQKRIVPFTYFKKSHWNDYLDNSEEIVDEEVRKIKVIGNIFINQKRYKKVTENYTEKDKINDKNYGVVKIKLTQNYIKKHEKKLNGEEYALFDLKEAKDTKNNLFVKTIGYAEVEDDTYVRMCEYSLIPLIIFLLMIAAMLIFLLFPKDPDKNPPDMAEQSPYNDTVTDPIPDPTENFAITLKDAYTVSKDSPNIELRNYKMNVLQISYDIYKEDGTYLGSTGRIEPGNKADFNIYSVFKKSGTYKISIRATSYNDDGTQNPTSGKILTKIIIT